MWWLLTNERTHGTTILFKEKEYLRNSRRSSVPLCSQSPYRRSLTQVISDLGPVSVDRFFSSRNSHKWNPRVCTFSLTQHDAFESYPYCCHVSGICTTLVRSTYSFEWICHNPIYLFTSWWTFEMFSIRGLLWTKLLQTSPFCGLMLYKFHLHF